MVNGTLARLSFLFMDTQTHRRTDRGTKAFYRSPLRRLPENVTTYEAKNATKEMEKKRRGRRRRRRRRTSKKGLNGERIWLSWAVLKEGVMSDV